MTIKEEMHKYIKNQDKDSRAIAGNAYNRYYMQLHRLKPNESMMYYSRLEFVYYYLLWMEIVDIFSQLNKPETVHRTHGAIHYTSSACRFVTHT